MKKTKKQPTQLPVRRWAICVIILLTTAYVSGQTLQLDFGGDSTAEGWNLIPNEVSDGTPMDLLEPNGASSGVVLKATVPWNGVNSVGHPDGAGAFPAEATTDSVYGNDVEFSGVTAPNPSMEINGLNPDVVYSFTVFASRINTSDNRTTLYTATGANVVTGELNTANNGSESIVLSGIMPTPEGVVMFDFTKAASNDNGFGFCYLGGLIISDNVVTLEDYLIPFSPDPERHRDEIDSFLANDTVNMPPEGAIVATGSSSIRGWHSRIHNDLDGLTIIARGFGGSFFSDVIYYVEEIILPYNPRAVLIYEGDNDISDGKTPESVLSDLQFLVNYCRSTLPDLRFYVISIKPSIARWNAWAEMAEANSLMEAYCRETEGMLYIDAGTILLQQDGTPRTDIFGSDNLHFNSAGYDAWASVIAPIMLENEQEFEDTTGPVEFDETALYIDFGNATAEAGWNSITMDQLDGLPLELVDGTGNFTDVSIKVLERFNGVNESGTSGGLDAFIPDATSDSVYGNDVEFSGFTAPNPSFQFEGLDTEVSYNFTIFASRMGASDVRSTLYTALGTNKVSGELDAADNELGTVTLEGIIPDANGSIIFDFKKAASNNNGYGFTYLGGMVVEEVTNTAVLIDFGGDSTAEGWNLVNDSLMDGGDLALLDANGFDSGLTFSAVSRWNSINTSGTPDGTGDLPSTVSADSIYGNDVEFSGVTAPNPALEISGMDSGSLYKFTIFASRMGVSDDRSAQYTINGDMAVSGILNSANNTHDVLILNSIAPDGDGRVVLDFRKADSNTNGYGFIYLGAMIIEKSHAHPVEPKPLPWDETNPGDFVVSPWFGPFTAASGGWLNHSEMIWLYTGEITDTSNMWIYSLYLESWVWSNKGTFPVVYNATTGDWVYYFKIPDIGVWEHNLSIGEWIFHP